MAILLWIIYYVFFPMLWENYEKYKGTAVVDRFRWPLCQMLVQQVLYQSSEAFLSHYGPTARIGHWYECIVCCKHQGPFNSHEFES